MLFDLNVIHTRSNWLCWKAHEKFQVEFRFCKTIGCSYVNLLTTYLAKKKQCLKLSTETLGKDIYWFQKETIKTSERCHLTSSYLREVTVQNHILDSLQCQFAIKSLSSVLLSSSAARNFNNSRPIYVILWEMRNNYRTAWFMKNSKWIILKKDNFFITFLTKVSWKIL